MACVYLTKTKKDELVYQYTSDHERCDVKSGVNNDLLVSLATEFFQKRKLKEFENERGTLDIKSLRVDSSDYDAFLKRLLSELTSRIKSLDLDEWQDLENDDASDEADSLQELLSLSLFLRRYYGFSADKKYKDYTFYIIPPAKI